MGEAESCTETRPMVVSEPYWESGTGTKPMADAFLYCLSLCVLIHCRSQYEGMHGRTQRKGGRGIHATFSDEKLGGAWE